MKINRSFNKDYIFVGVIKNINSSGEFKIKLFLEKDKILGVSVFFDEYKNKLEIFDIKIKKTRMLFKIKGDNIDIFCGNHIFALKSDLKLKNNEYFIDEIIGFEVIDKNKKEKYGILKNVINTNYNDVYVIENKKNNKEFFLPAVSEFIYNISIEKRIILVTPIIGMFN